MMVMPANNKSGFVHYWAAKCPGAIGHLWSPEKSLTLYPWLPYAVDNGKFAKGGVWSADFFMEFCRKVKAEAKSPLWVAAPDVPYNASATLSLWDEWEPILRKMGFRVAFVAQNNLKPSHVPTSADAIFMGGTDEWKYSVLSQFVSLGKPVHVGRVNGNKVWQCYREGAASCDGSGWFRGDRQQLDKLEQFLKFQAEELGISMQQLNLTMLYFEQKPRIPKNIKREHLLMAIDGWWQVPKQNEAQKYAVRHGQKLYPVKMLIARANLYANGYCLDPRSFSGGRDANRFVSSRGFEVSEI